VTIPADLVERLRAENEIPGPDGDWREVFIVVSHDCDVVNESLVAEPFVEIAAGHCIPNEARDGNVFWGKNPRRYQLIDESGPESRIVGFNIHRIYKVPRSYLCNATPDTSVQLSKENISRVCRWISLRYSRASFPDAFNERTRGVVSSLRKPLKKHGHLLSGVYILVCDDELPESSDYEIIVWATMRSEDYADREQRADAQKLIDQIEVVMTDSDGIDVRACELRSEEEVSLSDLRLLKRWDFDDLSLRDEPVSELPPPTD
jgi:hypothetical protein